MSTSNDALSQNIENNTRISPSEHILNVIKAGLATTPFCGGIASLMNDYIPSGKLIRLETFARQLAEDMHTLQDQIDENKILTDEYAFLFEKCFRGVAENYQAEKLESFKNILLNAAIGSDLSGEEKEYYLNLLTTLSVLHIRILHFMSDPLQYLKANGIPQESIGGGFSDFFPVALPGIDIEIIKSAFGDLHQSGFITTDKSIFSTTTSGQGLHLLGNRVTELGRKFVAFCTRPV